MTETKNNIKRDVDNPSPMSMTESALIREFRNFMKADIDIDVKPDNIGLICSNSFIGMGQLISDCYNESCSIPTTVTIDTRIPGWVNENSLIILIIDHSRKDNLVGMLARLRNKGCKIILITDFDTEASKGIAFHHKVTADYGYAFLGETLGILTSIFGSLNLIPRENVEKYISAMEGKYAGTSVELDLNKYPRKNIMISYPPNLRSTAAIWQATFTLILKRSVFITEYPEFNHNEIVGWCMSPNQSKRFVNIFILDENVDRLLSVISRSQMEVLSESGTDIVPISINGRNNFEKNLLGFLIGEKITNSGGKQ